MVEVNERFKSTMTQSSEINEIIMVVTSLHKWNSTADPLKSAAEGAALSLISSRASDSQIWSKANKVRAGDGNEFLDDVRSPCLTTEPVKHLTNSALPILLLNRMIGLDLNISEKAPK